MDHFGKKDVIQAILIADNNMENFRPLSDSNSTVSNNLSGVIYGLHTKYVCSSLKALIPLVNVAMLDYALEALNRSGIEEVFIFTSLHLQNVRDHIK